MYTLLQYNLFIGGNFSSGRGSISHEEKNNQLNEAQCRPNMSRTLIVYHDLVKALLECNKDH